MANKKPATAKRKSRNAIADPRQVAFLVAYTDPKSPTYGNALQSALKAGYSQEYSESLTSQAPKWLTESSENLGNDKRLKLAEKHLDEVLTMPIIGQAMGAFGPLFMKQDVMVEKTMKDGSKKMVKRTEKVPVMTYQMSRVKEKTKVVEIALEAYDKATYGKDKGPKFSFVFDARAERAEYE